MKSKLQIIGALNLVIAFILFCALETGLSLIVLLQVGILDVYLVYKGEQTISQWIQDLTYNKTIDYAIMGLLLVATIYVFWKQLGFTMGLTAGLPVLMAVLALHLFGNKNEG